MLVPAAPAGNQPSCQPTWPLSGKGRWGEDGESKSRRGVDWCPIPAGLMARDGSMMHKIRAIRHEEFWDNTELEARGVKAVAGTDFGLYTSNNRSFF